MVVIGNPGIGQIESKKIRKEKNERSRGADVQKLI
jgi:hypothetical protein